MKKIFTFFKATTLLLSLLVSIKSSAGPGDKYTCGLNMVPSIRTYEYLTEGTRVMDLEADDATAEVPLGFTFRHGTCDDKGNFTKLQVSSNGWVKLLPNTLVAGSQPNPGLQKVWCGFAPLWSDLSGVGGTATYYTELLPSGTRVFTMEWKNWRWDKLATAASVSFQLKLYEGSDIIEYCYKTESAAALSSPLTPAMIAIFGKNNPFPITASTPPCPGFDFAIFKDVIPIDFNTAGLYGAGISELPADNQVFQFYFTCCGKPEAGVISQPDSVCACTPFVAKLAGATPSPFTAYGVTYQWQSSPTGAATSWVDIGGPTTATSLSFPGICGGVDTFLRVIVKCQNSGKTDTTPTKHITLITLPYNCYCYSSSTIDDNLNMVNIGNVKLITKGNDTMINNVDSGGYPGFLNKKVFRPYTLFTGLRPIPIINRDSSYKFSVMGITREDIAFSSSGVALYIDYNHDGAYDPSAELASFNVISGTSTSFIANFTVPAYASLDTVGMRVVMKKGATTAASVPPCGGYSEGETEDYLVSITNPLCPGPLDPGKAFISDTSMCYGYPVTIWDSTHAKNLNGMHWEWEYSLDNKIWANVLSAKNKDVIQPVVRQNTYYRLRIVCETTLDTIYSNKVYIKLKQPYKCYCYSLANGNLGGNTIDSSDITTVKLHTFTANSGGPHLNNPESIRNRTDRTDLPAIELWSNTKYPIAVFHTLNTRNHADARISVFMDFNHNLAYDAPSELIWTHVTSATDFFPHDTILIPAAVIPDVETGMRVVLNNDLGTSNPSDVGCDELVSGEIEDYLVIFRRGGTGITEIPTVDNLQIYPNPNNGQFTISFNASKKISEASVSVTNLTGQQIFTEKYTNISSSFMKNINLGNQASGVYFITIVADGQKCVNKLTVQ